MNKIKKLWKKYNLKWVFFITIWSFILTIIFSLLSDTILNQTKVFVSALILLFIIFLGVLSDTIGIAITAASIKPFHAMASDKVVGADYAILLKKNTGPVSNFCNDVIGDICGIISGVAGANLVMQIDVLSNSILTILTSSIIVSLTVGGKALGKNIAVHKAHSIVFFTAKVLTFLKDKFGISFLHNKKKKGSNY